MRFPEETQVTEALVQEWYANLREVSKKADGIFSVKAKYYDVISPVWHRIDWPRGFLQELGKKTDRIVQMLSRFDADAPEESAPWDEIEEELLDISNYARMFAAITLMVRSRGGTTCA